MLQSIVNTTHITGKKLAMKYINHIAAVFTEVRGSCKFVGYFLALTLVYY